MNSLCRRRVGDDVVGRPIDLVGNETQSLQEIACRGGVEVIIAIIIIIMAIATISVIFVLVVVTDGRHGQDFGEVGGCSRGTSLHSKTERGEVPR